MSTRSCCACWPTVTIRSLPQRTRSICRLHALLCLLIEGGTGRSLTVARAEKLLASVYIDGPITIERIVTAGQLIDEVSALDAARVEVRRRHVDALEASKTTVTEVFGIGPLMAAIIVGRSGDVRRFPSAGHFARHNGTAPIEASSGPTRRHRLNPRGDRQLNHAIHIAAVTQVRNDTPGRAYYVRTQTEESRATKHCARSSDASATTSSSAPAEAPQWAREDNARTSLNPA
jgi:transposase